MTTKTIYVSIGNSDGVNETPELSETTKTETTVRHYDTDGQLTSETVTVVTQHRKPDEDLHVGMYL